MTEMMNKYNFKIVTDYQQISDLITAHFKKGVRTNTAMSRQEYEREIALGTILAGETPQGLVMLRNRFSRIMVNYYFNDISGENGELALDALALAEAARDTGWDLTIENGSGVTVESGGQAAEEPEQGIKKRKPIVAETAFREKDAGLKETSEYFGKCGFKEILSRVRLSRAAGAENSGGAVVKSPAAHVRRAAAQDTEAVKKLLFECFDIITGCLPEDDELETDAAAGNFLLLFDGSDEEPAGLLHFSAGKKSAEIKHLCLRAGARGRGLSLELINAFIAEFGGIKMTVWTGSENHAALSAYKECGFEEDGRRSSVRVFEI